MNKQNRTVTVLFNPFYYLAGGKALGIGLAVVWVAGLVGAAGKTHFDGVLDAHTGAGAPLWFFLCQGFIDWICLAAVLLGLGAAVSKSSFRAIDVLGTQALARWPALFMALLMLPDAVRRFGAQLIQLVGNPDAKFDINVPDAVVFGIVTLATIPLVCWMIYLMYKAYSVSFNVKGGKAIGSFIGGLIAAEVLSKLAITLLLAPVAIGKTSATTPPTTPQSVQSAAAQTGDESGGLAEAGARFVDLLAKENFAAAFAQFEATMTRVFPESKLRESWLDLVQKAGPFKERLKTRIKEQQGYHVVLVTCQFERATLDIKVVFDSKSQIAGLFYVPSDSR
jgi:hypothetical protein